MFIRRSHKAVAGDDTVGSEDAVAIGAVDDAIVVVVEPIVAKLNSVAVISDRAIAISAINEAIIVVVLGIVADQLNAGAVGSAINNIGAVGEAIAVIVDTVGAGERLGERFANRRTSKLWIDGSTNSVAAIVWGRVTIVANLDLDIVVAVGINHAVTANTLTGH